MACAGLCSMGSALQCGGLVGLQPAMSGTRCLDRRRPSVRSFPLEWAFPTAEDSACYDTPSASSGFPPTWFVGLPPKGRCQSRAVSGFLPLCLTLCVPCFCCPHVRSPWGLPACSDASLPVGHGLWTPADLHPLATAGALVLPSVCVTTLGVRLTLLSKRYQHFRVRVTPTASRMLSRRFVCLVRRLPATPPQTQDAIRVGGSPLPDGDFHPARSAELISAR
jgi:hypothetical protein